MNTQADVLLVTVSRVESLAVLAAFEQHTGKKPRVEPRGDKTYHNLGTVNGARVWLVRSEMGTGNLGGSQQTVSKAIAEVRPSAVVMVGIAFGMNEKKQAIGDILVSENLRLYELQRIGSKRGQPKIILRGDRPHGSPWLLDAFKNADLHWQGAKVRFGCVLTGEKLVDNVDFREQLRAFEPEAIGGEMEGAGLYVACQDAKVDWLLVKAICDWVDGHKSRNKVRRQTRAARNAAEFVLHTLKTIGLNKRKPMRHTRRRRKRKTASPGALVQIGGKAKVRDVKVIRSVKGNINM
jgi:nucleoside phosphorylase